MSAAYLAAHRRLPPRRMNCAASGSDEPPRLRARTLCDLWHRPPDRTGPRRLVAIGRLAPRSQPRLSDLPALLGATTARQLADRLPLAQIGEILSADRPCGLAGTAVPSSRPTPPRPPIRVGRGALQLGAPAPATGSTRGSRGPGPSRPRRVRRPGRRSTPHPTGQMLAPARAPELPQPVRADVRRDRVAGEDAVQVVEVARDEHHRLPQAPGVRRFLPRTERGHADDLDELGRDSVSMNPQGPHASQDMSLSPAYSAR